LDKNLSFINSYFSKILNRTEEQGKKALKEFSDGVAEVTDFK
jgi:hypothetical protein